MLPPEPTSSDKVLGYLYGIQCGSLQNLVCHAPVSYTHLTLPTMCQV